MQLWVKHGPLALVLKDSVFAAYNFGHWAELQGAEWFLRTADHSLSAIPGFLDRESSSPPSFSTLKRSPIPLHCSEVISLDLRSSREPPAVALLPLLELETCGGGWEREVRGDGTRIWRIGFRAILVDATSGDLVFRV